MRINYTCPLIDEIIEIIDLTTENKKGTINICIKNKLEQLRQSNIELRKQAEYYKSLYNATIFHEYEFNPEVLPE